MAGLRVLVCHKLLGLCAVCNRWQHSTGSDLRAASFGAAIPGLDGRFSIMIASQDLAQCPCWDEHLLLCECSIKIVQPLYVAD